MITPTGDVRIADPLLWFSSTTQRWEQQVVAIRTIGATVDLPVLLSARFRDTSLAARRSEVDALGLAVAIEPFSEALGEDVIPAWRRRERPWLVPPTPQRGELQSWMEDSLRHQDGFSPSLLLSPCPTLDIADGSTILEAVADAAEGAREALGSRVPTLLGISGGRDWLRRAEALSGLGNVLVHTQLPGVYLRISHRESVVRDQQYLSGLRDLVAGLANAGKLVFLPNSGSLGWLALGWGAWSLSAGITGGTWAERESTRMNQPLQPSQWYYEHQLGFEVRWRHHANLVGLPDYRWCECRFCSVLRNGYDPDLARLHGLDQLARDVRDLVSAGGSEERIRRLRERLSSMQSFGRSVETRLGNGWEGYPYDFTEKWMAVL